MQPTRIEADTREAFADRHIGPRGAELATMLATVGLDLTQAIVIGIVLQSFLFISQVSQLSVVASDVDWERLHAAGHDDLTAQPGIKVVYVTGPIFFGAAQQLAERIEELGDCAILILSMHPEEQYAVNLLRAGANGYITKDAVPQQVVQAIRTLLQGRKYISPTVAQILAEDIGGDGRPRHETLSEREFQVFCKLAAGRSVGEIADELFLSNKTVSTYRARIMEKLGAKNAADLVRIVFSEDRRH